MNPVESLGMNDVRDLRGVPVSTGIPPIVRVSGVIGFLLVLVVIGMVIFASGYGHVWPSENSAKIDLPTSGVPGGGPVKKQQ